MDQEKVDQIFGLIEESLDEDHAFQMETILEDIEWDSIAALTFMSLVMKVLIMLFLLMLWKTLKPLKIL